MAVGELILIWFPSLGANTYGIQIIFNTAGKTPYAFIRNLGGSAGWGEWRTIALTLA